MAKKRKSNFYIKVSGQSRSVALNTQDLFLTEISPNESPIDIYIKRNKSLLIKLGELERGGLLDNEKSSDRDLYNLFLLGLVSNVESFFRHLLRELILLDATSYQQCLDQQLTYAAAIHHQPCLLPEALLENCTFISFDNIKSTTKNYLDVTINKTAPEQKELVDCLFKFEQLCHLRHCIVHRAGLLGSKNAVKLGIDEHKVFFEKPMSLSSAFLHEANAICLNCVKNYNNFLFNSLIKRHIDNNRSLITWNYNIDRKWYAKYFNLFSSKDLNSESSRQGVTYYSAKKAYDEIREHYSTS